MSRGRGLRAAAALAPALAALAVAAAPALAQSRAVGQPWHGRLVGGVLLPAQGPSFFTYDLILGRAPNRTDRRWGTEELILTIDDVLAEYRSEDPDAPRVGIADLSRRHGGPFGRRYGGLGHRSHQNGLDVDVLYPRRDRTERPPRRAADVDRRRAQELVDLFVDYGAQFVFVDPALRLRGPRAVVGPLPHHQDQMHVRIYNPDR